MSHRFERVSGELARSRFHRDRSATERYRSFRRMVLLDVHPSVVYTRRRFSGTDRSESRIFWIVWSIVLEDVER